MIYKKVDKKLNIFLLIIIAFTTFKYHNDYNINRKFMDLQNTNLNNSIDAKILNEKFNNLKWITPFHFNKDPKKEIEFLQEAILVISKEDEKKFALITHYQFFSLLSEKRLTFLIDGILQEIILILLTIEVSTIHIIKKGLTIL